MLHNSRLHTKRKAEIVNHSASTVMERGPEFHVWSIHSKHSFTLLMHQTSIHVQCSLGSKFPSYVLFILSSQNAVRFQLWPSSQSTDCTCSLRVSVWLTPQCWICLRSCSQHSSWRNYSLPAPSSCRLPSFLLTPVQYWSEMHCITVIKLPLALVVGTLTW